MSDYTRSTRECRFDALRPELAEAIRAHAAEYELGGFEQDVVICVETANEKIKKDGLFGKLMGGDPDPAHYTAVVVTPAWFFHARSGAKSGVVVLSARLAAMTARDYDSKLIPDHGLELTAQWTDASQPSMLFCGLGQEPAAERFKQVLRDAIAAAR